MKHPDYEWLPKALMTVSAEIRTYRIDQGDTPEEVERREEEDNFNLSVWQQENYNPETELHENQMVLVAVYPRDDEARMAWVFVDGVLVKLVLDPDVLFFAALDACWMPNHPKSVFWEPFRWTADDTEGPTKREKKALKDANDTIDALESGGRGTNGGPGPQSNRLRELVKLLEARIAGKPLG